MTNMVDWDITATTVYCDNVDDEVTFIVTADGTARCTGYQKYFHPDKKKSRLSQKKNQLSGKQSGCIGDECQIVIQYRDSILNVKDIR